MNYNVPNIPLALGFVSQVHQRNDINSCVKQFEEELPNLDEFQKGLVCIPDSTAFFRNSIPNVFLLKLCE